jgi:hypothetical protein
MIFRLPKRKTAGSGGFRIFAGLESVAYRKNPPQTGGNPRFLSSSYRPHPAIRAVALRISVYVIDLA